MQEIINFTPTASLLGGLLLGASASLLALFYGKILGISGIIGGVLNQKRGDILWRAVLISGIILSPVIYSFFFQIKNPEINTPWFTLAIAGVLVGYGTRLGSGCTSGHGICGIGRLSQRSIVSVLIFMSVAIITKYIFN